MLLPWAAAASVDSAYEASNIVLEVAAAAAAAVTSALAPRMVQVNMTHLQLQAMPIVGMCLRLVSEYCLSLFGVALDIT